MDPIKELQEQVKSLVAKSEAQTKTIETLTVQGEEQTQTIANLEKQSAELLDTLSKAGAVPKPEPKKPEIPNETFKVDKKEYCFRTASFIWMSKADKKPMSITAQDALLNPELLSDLVERNAGVIIRVK